MNTPMKPKMRALELVEKTREYLDYVERHINNVARAWMEIQEKYDGPCTWDDYRFHSLHDEVEAHDVSKLGKAEFTRYRRVFYPTWEEEKTPEKLGKAWVHHQKHNPHHWENWTTKKFYNPYEAEMHCTHMVVDWLAMSYEFGDSPRAYYEKNKEHIALPAWAVDYIYEIFAALDGGTANPD